MTLLLLHTFSSNLTLFTDNFSYLLGSTYNICDFSQIPFSSFIWFKPRTDWGIQNIINCTQILFFRLTKLPNKNYLTTLKPIQLALPNFFITWYYTAQERIHSFKPPSTHVLTPIFLSLLPHCFRISLSSSNPSSIPSPRSIPCSYIKLNRRLDVCSHRLLISGGKCFIRPPFGQLVCALNLPLPLTNLNMSVPTSEVRLPLVEARWFIGFIVWGCQRWANG